jgi:FixJ family two-component response regulator
LTRLLRSHGFEASPFATGEELLAAPAAQTSGCLLLDLHMPGLTGFDVLEALAAAKSPLRVVVVTGHDEPGNGLRVRALGALAYLLKPVDESALISAIVTVSADGPSAKL